MKARLVVLAFGLMGCFAGEPDAPINTARKVPAGDKCKPGREKKKCTTTSATIGPAGGTIVTPDGLSLHVPYGAVDANTVLSVMATTIAPDSAIGGVGTVYAFEPE